MPHSVVAPPSPGKLSKPRPPALLPTISPPRKRFSLVRTHVRSKSLNLTAMTLPPLHAPPSPSPSPSPSPMLRSSSLPLVIPEGKMAPSFTTTPPTPTTPRRTTSPTSYHPGSAFPSLPPNYLINEPYTPSTSPSTTPRSRSPSVSSLETIPDSPDAEAEAEAEVIVVSSRRSMDLGGSPVSWGREKRKRWSVCGAEKRADLELETIWEDAPARKMEEVEEDQDRVD